MSNPYHSNQPMNEEKATSILQQNLKATNRTADLLEVASACRLLIRAWGIKRMSSFFDISEYQLRQIDRVNQLRSDVKRLVRAGKLGLDSSYQLSRLKGLRQSACAREATNLTSSEVRQLVQLLLNNDLLTVKGALEKVRAETAGTIRILSTPLPVELYTKLVKLAYRRKKTLEHLVVELLEESVRDETS